MKFVCVAAVLVSTEHVSTADTILFSVVCSTVRYFLSNKSKLLNNILQMSVKSWFVLEILSLTVMLFWGFCHSAKKNRWEFSATKPAWIDTCTAIFLRRQSSQVMMTWRWRRFLLAVCLRLGWGVGWRWRRRHFLSTGLTEFLQTKFSSITTLTRFDLWLWIFFSQFSFL